MAAMAQDMRQHKRFKVPQEGFLVGRLDEDLTVEIIDLSAGGVALKAGSRLSVGREYSMRLHDRKHQLEVRGTVVRSQILETRQPVVGKGGAVYASAMRLQAGVEDRVADFICETLLV
jgi:c-di-GMP-binding flagellar brake protein YcgR